MAASAQGTAGDVSGDASGSEGGASADALFAGPGEMRARCRAHDWAATPLGPVDGWPAALRVAVRLMLASPVATSLWCGPDYTLLYNDAYAPILGAKHPGALGRSGAAVWAELWPALEPDFARVRAGGPPVFADDALLRMERLEGGRAEDAWFTYALSALTDEAGACLAVYNVAVEVTARARAARERDAERAQLADIVRLSPAFMAVLRGPDHVIALTNAGYDALVGGRDVRGRTVAEALPEAAAQGFVALLDRVLATGEPFVGREVPYRRPDARGVEDERYVDFVYQALAESDGTRSGVFVHGVDVTDQVRARREIERLLAESEAANALLQEQGLELELSNHQLHEQAMELELQAEELQATAAHLEERTEAAERAGARAAFLAEASRLLASSLDPAATLASVAQLAVPALADWCGVDLVDESTGAVEQVAVAHADPARVAWARQVRRDYPAPPDAPTGVPAVVRTGRAEFYAEVTDAMLAAGARDAAHLALMRELGITSVIIAPLQARGRTLGALSLVAGAAGRRFTPDDLALAEELGRRAGMAVDNARVHAAAEAARAAAERARAEAEAAGRLKAEFLATMSHEFRTPLNAILGYAQLLEMGVLGPATPAQQAHLARVQTGARHLIQIVDDVLDVAKADADRLAVRRDAFATGAAVASALVLLQPQATAKGIRLLDLSPPGPGAPYVGDEHRVRQILVNLLSNAVKFTPPGREVTLTAGAAAEPEPGAQAREAGAGAGSVGAGSPGAPAAWAFVRVEDAGPGIAPEVLGRLFEPFVQADGALTREHGGTGLGLAISRRLARLMGGDLTVRNRPGAGATFTLWLPGPARAEQLPASPRPTDAGPARTTPPGVAAAADPADPAGAPLDAAAYAVLHALGVRLAAEAEAVAARYVAALRADGRFPGARELPDVQLRDHAAPFVGLLASHLMIVGETRGRAPELLGDGAQMQRVMAELHGAQRHRLGWAEADVKRETPLLLDEVERALASAVRAAPATAPATAPAGGAPDDGGAATTAAERYAADVARHVLEQATRTALRAHRFAAATAGP